MMVVSVTTNSSKSPPQGLTSLHGLSTCGSVNETNPESGRGTPRMTSWQKTAYRWARPALFKLDAETAHDLTMSGLERLDPILPSHPATPPLNCSRLQQTLFGRVFHNPVGLAAGLDKNGRATRAFAALGFGHIEIGTITPRPQSGNPRPRLFRYPEEHAIINRMGFNSEGAQAVAANLHRRVQSIPLGINVGPNKETVASEIADTILQAMTWLAPYADHWVLNLSSPNTPGLRGNLHPDRLGPTLDRIQLGLHGSPLDRPLLLKVSPDSTPEDLIQIARTARDCGVSGIIATNTSVERMGNLPSDQTGGLSGRPLRLKSRMALRILRDELGPQMPLIAVGGIESANEIFERLQAGASLIQVYSGLIYQGPTLVKDLVAGLIDRMDDDGIEDIAALRAC